MKTSLHRKSWNEILSVISPKALRSPMRSTRACVISHCTLACTAERYSPYFVSILPIDWFILLSLLYRILGISFGSISRMANNNTTRQPGSSESQPSSSGSPLGSTECQRGTLRQPDDTQSSPTTTPGQSGSNPNSTLSEFNSNMETMATLLK